MEQQKKMSLDDEEQRTNSENITDLSEENIEDTQEPVLDEEDLEENDLTEEDADAIEWEEDKGSSGNEEKDIA